MSWCFCPLHCAADDVGDKALGTKLGWGLFSGEDLDGSRHSLSSRPSKCSGCHSGYLSARQSTVHENALNPEPSEGQQHRILW